MNISYKIIDKTNIDSIIPLVQKLNGHKDSDAVLKERFKDMVKENYECAGIFNANELIGICGMWFQTRHYIGKSVEVDHVYIEPSYRSKGLGKLFFEWIYKYAKTKGCNASELNTYVQNYPSHKFYYNEGYEILGYHFLKKL